MSLRATAVVVSPRILGGRYCPGFCFLDCAEACRRMQASSGVGEELRGHGQWQNLQTLIALVQCRYLRRSS